MGITAAIVAGLFIWLLILARQVEKLAEETQVLRTDLDNVRNRLERISPSENDDEESID